MENAQKILQFVRPDSKIPFPQDREKQISRNRLVNRLNYINFQDGSLLVNFRHSKYSRTITLEARPHPCKENSVQCSWSEPFDVLQKLRSSTFENLFVIDGHKLVIVEPTVIEMGEEGISFALPETCRELSYRKVRRHLCEGVAVQFTQNSALFMGKLVDFNAVSFRVDVQATLPQTFQWIDPDMPVNVALSDKNRTYYSGLCNIVRQTTGNRTRSFALSPVGQQTPRFRSKSYRSTRHHLAPSPNVGFTHPLTQEYVDLKVQDISGTGFSVEENAEDSVLLPGMIIPELELNFGNTFSATCQAQVVYRKEVEEDETLVRCGVAILDMDVQDHVNLLSLLYQVDEKNSYLNNRVDMEKLWQFFFETGFIYPEKYAFVKANKAKFRALYQKLYTKSPRIARHFIYQDKGSILGHMAMVRFYERSWLIHHHAATKVESNRAGLVVLNQIGRFINDSHRIPSINMDYVFCYYRPENRFPHRVFGGVARHLKDPQASSLDPMAYLHVKALEMKKELDDSWELEKSTPDDLHELDIFYENHSGGLAMRALDLEPGLEHSGDISKEYEAINFKRERHLLSLRKDGVLVAMFMVVLSDIGLNMSDLTNCITVFVLEEEAVGKEELEALLGDLVVKFGQEEMPALVYPKSFADSKEIPYEKTYNLWVLSMGHTDQYFAFLDKLIRTVKH